MTQYHTGGKQDVPTKGSDWPHMISLLNTEQSKAPGAGSPAAGTAWLSLVVWSAFGVVFGLR